jgi:hypothetical protein
VLFRSRNSALASLTVEAFGGSIQIKRSAY